MKLLARPAGVKSHRDFLDELGLIHGEAFCLMTYRSDDGAITEQLWNSRDGVTPFVIHSKDGVELTHVAWQFDLFIPFFIPAIGSRIFVDLTEEAAREAAERRVEARWDDGSQYAMKNHFSSKQEAVEIFVSSWLKDEGAPHVVEVTPEMQQQFAELAMKKLSET